MKTMSISESPGYILYRSWSARLCNSQHRQII